MLKGYLLANIDNQAKRLEADKLIKKYLSLFAEHSKETDADFFKAWLRSQYSTKIRERKKDAKPEDFDLIGTEYHRWVRNHAHEIGLNNLCRFPSVCYAGFPLLRDPIPAAARCCQHTHRRD